MKRILILISALVIVLTACGGDSSDGETIKRITFMAPYTSFNGNSIIEMSAAGTFNNWTEGDVDYTYTSLANGFVLARDFPVGDTLKFKFMYRTNATWYWIGDMEYQNNNGWIYPVPSSFEPDGFFGINAVIVVGQQAGGTRDITIYSWATQWSGNEIVESYLLTEANNWTVSANDKMTELANGFGITKSLAAGSSFQFNLAYRTNTGGTVLYEPNMETFYGNDLLYPQPSSYVDDGSFRNAVIVVP